MRRLVLKLWWRGAGRRGPHRISRDGNPAPAAALRECRLRIAHTHRSCGGLARWCQKKRTIEQRQPVRPARPTLVRASKRGHGSLDRSARLDALVWLHTLRNSECAFSGIAVMLPVNMDFTSLASPAPSFSSRRESAPRLRGGAGLPSPIRPAAASIRSAEASAPPSLRRAEPLAALARGSQSRRGLLQPPPRARYPLRASRPLLPTVTTRRTLRSSTLCTREPASSPVGRRSSAVPAHPGSSRRGRPIRVPAHQIRSFSTRRR
jgi:hypothetical protein